MVTLTLIVCIGLLVGWAYLIFNIAYWVEAGRPSRLNQKNVSIMQSGHELPPTLSAVLWFLIFSIGAVSVIMLIITLTSTTEDQSLERITSGIHVTWLSIVAIAAVLLNVGMIIWYRVASARAHG